MKIEDVDEVISSICTENLDSRDGKEGRMPWWLDALGSWMSQNGVSGFVMSKEKGKRKGWSAKVFFFSVEIQNPCELKDIMKISFHLSHHYLTSFYILRD